jgi:hypothetical protein
MAYYSISAQVPEGQGDYGSDWLCVLNAQKMPSKRIAVNVANRLASERNTRVLVFIGKDLGKLIHDTQEESQQ